MANEVVIMPAEEIVLGMTNFDHTIDDGFAEALQAQPNRVFGRHSGWNFNGMVWWNGTQFVEAVFQYHVLEKVLTAPTLEELMIVVSEEYGWE